MTEENIATDSTEETATTGGIIATAKKHPLITGSLLLVGAGAAYAIAKSLTSGDEVAKDVHIQTSIAINKTPEELYAFWRDFKNLPIFMKNLVSVTEIDRWNSHWVAKGLGGARVEWDAEVYNEEENKLISWRSLENADIVNAGSVRFEKAPEGHGPYVRVTVNYNPPAGKLGATLAQLLGTEPLQLIKEDLRRLKQLMEAGEIPTIAGQTSGRASVDEIPTEKATAEEEKVSTQAA